MSVMKNWIVLRKKILEVIKFGIQQNTDLYNEKE